MTLVIFGSHSFLCFAGCAAATGAAVNGKSLGPEETRIVRFSLATC
jgi:hypothetical protein